jgi:hypothetical protein
MKKLTNIIGVIIQVGMSGYLAFGILFLGWNPNDSVAVYFLETLILGIINIPLLIACALYGPSRIEGAAKRLFKPGEADRASDEFESKSRVKSAIIAVIVFPIHYGLFLLMQLFAVTYAAHYNDPVKFNFFATGIFSFFSNINGDIWLVVAGIAFIRVVDGIIFFVKKNYRTTHEYVQMLSPYKRIIVQQLAVILGSSFIYAFHLKAAFAIIIIVIKITFDIWIGLFGRDEWAPFRLPDKKSVAQPK